MTASVTAGRALRYAGGSARGLLHHHPGHCPNLIYAEASWSQSLSDWIGAHCRAFAYFGGVPAQVVCDNLKSGVTKACFYEPAVNRTYADMAAHYGTAVVPARPYKPRDKAKVEVAVQIAERWIAARLRNQRFFSLAELNAAIRGLLDRLNEVVHPDLEVAAQQVGGQGHKEECTLRGQRDRCRELGHARLAGRHLQDIRREPGRLRRRHAPRYP